MPYWNDFYFKIKLECHVCDKEGYKLVSKKPKTMASNQIPIYQRQARRPLVVEGTLNSSMSLFGLAMSNLTLGSCDNLM